MTRIAIYSAIFGGYDNYSPHVKQSIDCDMILFTDGSLKVELNEGSDIKVFKSTDDNTPNTMRGVFYRCCPFRVPELSNYDLLIYIDGNITITNADFLKDMIERNNIGQHSLSLSCHPYRD